MSQPQRDDSFSPATGLIRHARTAKLLIGFMQSPLLQEMTVAGPPGFSVKQQWCCHRPLTVLRWTLCNSITHYLVTPSTLSSCFVKAGALSQGILFVWFNFATNSNCICVLSMPSVWLYWVCVGTLICCTNCAFPTGHFFACFLISKISNVICSEMKERGTRLYFAFSNHGKCRNVVKDWAIHAQWFTTMCSGLVNQPKTRKRWLLK